MDTPDYSQSVWLILLPFYSFLMNSVVYTAIAKIKKYSSVLLIFLLLSVIVTCCHLTILKTPYLYTDPF